MFSKRCFSEWCIERVVRIRNGKRYQNALKHWCFQAFFVPLKGFSSVASRGEESEKHRLENTVCYSLERSHHCKALAMFKNKRFSNLGRDQKNHNIMSCLSWIQEGFKGGFSVEAPTIRGAFLADSVRILGFCPAVTLTCGPYFCAENPESFRRKFAAKPS